MKKFFKKFLVYGIVMGIMMSSTGLSGCAKEIKAEYFDLPKEALGSEIKLEGIDGLPDDFIRGMDASSVIAEEDSGVKFFGFDGKERDVIKTLAEGGVNYLRIRVWNDPYDSEDHGYGGGNCDVKKAVELGTRATKYGMKVNIDFHYSDFWADPKKQFVPKAWENMSLSEKSDALYDFTVESLETILDAGVNVGMVQIGNEINNGMCGERDLDDVITLLKSGSRAVRYISKKYEKEIKVVVHYTDIEEEARVNRLVNSIESADLDYDILGLSYYPYWHGTMAHMKSVVSNMKEKTGKEICIMETAYPFTSRDGDGTENSVKGTDDIVDGYEASVQGQASMIRDICADSFSSGAIGIFYWEGTWIPVGPASQKSENSKLWEEYGSGWASSFAKEYDPNDAGKYFGGSSWDNQALFDSEGHPLESLNTFKYLRYGTK